MMASDGAIDPGGKGGVNRMEPAGENDLNRIDHGGKIDLQRTESGGEDDLSSVDSSGGVRSTGLESDEANKFLSTEFNTDTVDSGYMNTESDLSEELMSEELMNVSDGNISMDSNANSDGMTLETEVYSQNKVNEISGDSNDISNNHKIHSNEDDDITCEEISEESVPISLESTIKSENTNKDNTGPISTNSLSTEADENKGTGTIKSTVKLEQNVLVSQAAVPAAGMASDIAMPGSSATNATNTNNPTRPQGNYEELSEIGNGAYGTVYKARDLLNEGRVVALKKIRISLSDEGVPVNAVREIAMLKQLERYEHPNIVRLLDICHGQLEQQSKLTLIMVFEYMDQDLDHYLKRCPSPGLEPERIKSIMHQILCGVDFLHSNRIIHRDLKPQNVLVDGNGRVKLADFGLARIYDFYMRLTTTVVTLWYRAPEVLLCNSYATPVDMWSCGCIFAELFRRKPFFEGRSEGDQLQIIFDTIGTPLESEWPTDVSLNWSNFRYHPGKLLKDVVPEITDDAVDLLKRMLTFRPEVRLGALSAKNHRYFSGLVAPIVTPNGAARNTPTQQMVSGSQYSTSNVVNAGISEAKANSSVISSHNTNDENNPNSGNTHNKNSVSNFGINNSDTNLTENNNVNNSDTNMAENNNVVNKLSDDQGHLSASNSLLSSSPMTNSGSKDENKDTREVIR